MLSMPQDSSAQVAAAPFAARPLRVLALRCATRGPERCRIRPSRLRRSFSSEPLRCRESLLPKTHHTRRHTWQPIDAARCGMSAVLFMTNIAFERGGRCGRVRQARGTKKITARYTAVSQMKILQKIAAKKFRPEAQWNGHAF